MKSRIFWKWTLGVSLITLPFAGGCRQNVSSPVISTNTALQSEAITPVAPPPVVPAPTGATNAPAPIDIAEAPVQPVTTEQPAPPPNIRTSGPTSEMVKLANSGVDEGVLLAFATNSTSTFNLGADEIIYLNDLGVPSNVVTAMIQRDQQLKALPTSAAPAAPVPTEAPNAAAPATGVPYSYAAPAAAAPLGNQPTALSPEQIAPQATAAAAYPATTYAAPAAYAAPAEAAPVSYGTFYDSLSPYGSWVEVEGYGRCWQPTVVAVNPGWRPYFDSGHWVYTDCGWYWLSDYSWGWAPFHYGRWFRHNRIGWCWAPDTVWGPSWVSWRYSDAHCGWAPLPPAACYRPGVGFTYYGRSVAVGFEFGLSADCYAFIGWNHFHEHRLHGYALPPHQVNRVYHNTTVVNNIVVQNNIVVNRGIAPTRVAAATHTQVHTVAVRTVSGTAHVGGGRVERFDANNRTLSVYRPVQATPATAPLAGHARNNLAAGRNAELATMGLNPAATPASHLAQGNTPAQPKFGPKAPLGTQPPAGLPPTVTARPERAPGHGATPQMPAANPAQNVHGRPPVVTPAANAAAGKEPSVRNSLLTVGRRESAPPAVFTRPATHSAPELPPQPAAAPAGGSALAPAQNPVPTPVAAMPRTPAQPAWTAPQAGNAAANFQRQAPARPTYQAPARPTLPAEPPRYTPAPAMTPQRSYSAPAPAPVWPQTMPSYSAPSRPMVTDTPRFNPGPSMSPTPRAQAAESRPSLSAPAAASHGASGRGSRNQP
ncbi:MAG TPA: DUF6600 domain-containing protein [Bacillota bacterium]|nr:DUF6600 domain-containing protein [Bacillota bacterium]